MDKLTQLAIKYGTDKWGKHHYTPVYYDLFKDRREAVRKVVEIGVGEGASLRMWRNFFPNAMTYGAEIDEGRVFTELRIKVIKCNQTSQDDLISLFNETGSNIDLFIDDGSHRPTDQLYTCLEVFPNLNRGAIYVIEDVADTSVLFKLPTRWNCQMVKVGKRYDDRLIIVRHKNG